MIANQKRVSGKKWWNNVGNEVRTWITKEIRVWNRKIYSFGKMCDIIIQKIRYFGKLDVTREVIGY